MAEAGGSLMAACVLLPTRHGPEGTPENTNTNSDGDDDNDSFTNEKRHTSELVDRPSEASFTSGRTPKTHHLPHK